MRIKEILIHNYKSICSEVRECRLKLDEKVTYLIGANEGGKTNILEAMIKFFQGGFKQSDIPYMSAWRSEPEIPDDLKMVSVTFAIDENEQQVLTKIHPALSKATEVSITRNYTDEPYISSPDLKAESRLDELLSDLGQDSKDFANKFNKYKREYKQVNKEAASSTRSASARLGSLVSQIDVLTSSFDPSMIVPTRRKIRRLETAIQRLANPLASIETDVLKPFEKIAKTVEELPKLRDAMKASQKLWELIPRFAFVPADPKLWLAGQYRVDDIINKPEDYEKLKSVRRLLSLAELNLDQTRNLREDMQAVTLERAAQKVTEVLKGVWKQEPDIELKLEWSPREGNRKLLVMIESAGHRGSPQDRSHGFRWFLEFYLIYATALHHNMVLVFEEPGIHLHPKAQDDLKHIMRDEVAAQSQIVYTTHLPGMYDLACPEGCRAVKKDSGVTNIVDQYSPEHQYTTWEVAMNALGIDAPFLRMFRRNIITEGPADWVYMLTFAKLLADEGPKIHKVASGLIHIFPSKGASAIPGIIPFFFQPGVKSVVLLDSDQAGKNCEGKLQTELSLPNDFIVDIVMTNDIEGIEQSLGSGEHEIEDLFGTKYYASLVSGWLGQHKLEGKLEKKDFKKQNLIGKQAKAIIKQKHRIKLDKADVAWYFHDLVLKSDPEIPEEVKDRFKNLLLRLTEPL